VSVSAERDAARAVRNLAKRTIEHHVNDHHYAQVETADPLSVTLPGGLHLDEEDLVLCYAVRHFDATVGLDTEDTLIVRKIGEDWVALAVVSDKEVVP
jgi:hypothetical protein